jgi:hypothetical protein
MARRTTHRSKSGKKLYAKRGRTGQFTDIQTYKRAHGSDIKRRAKAEKKYTVMSQPLHGERLREHALNPQYQ